MNRKKKNLILSASIINAIQMIFTIVLVAIFIASPDTIYNSDILYTCLYYSYRYTDIVTILFAVAGLVGSFCLIWAIRKDGKFFRRQQAWYYAGLIIVIVAGGYIPWILLLISMFVPDVVVMNRPAEVRREEKQENKEMEEKRRMIEELRSKRDAGEITEEEFNARLQDLL